MAQGGHEDVVGVEAQGRCLAGEVRVRPDQALHAGTAQLHCHALDVDAHCAALPAHLQPTMHLIMKLT